jgi:hypothetical protein
MGRIEKTVFAGVCSDMVNRAGWLEEILSTEHYVQNSAHD